MSRDIILDESLYHSCCSKSQFRFLDLNFGFLSLGFDFVFCGEELESNSHVRDFQINENDNSITEQLNSLLNL